MNTKLLTYKEVAQSSIDIQEMIDGLHKEIGSIYGVRVFLDESLPDNEWRISAGRTVYNMMLRGKQEEK